MSAMSPCFVEAAPDDAFAVGRKEGAAVVAVDRRQALHAGAVGVGAHDVDVGEEARVGLELLALRRRQVVVVRLARGGEGDPLAVGRVAGLGVVAARLRQPLVGAGLRVADVEVHLGVVVPRVAPLLAGGAELQLFVLQLLRARIVMRGGEEDVAGFGVEERAGGLARAGRDARDVAGGHVHHVDLVERIARLALALEHQPASVLRPVAFAGAAAFHREAPRPREEVALGDAGAGACDAR